jgi:hypothetical protein
MKTSNYSIHLIIALACEAKPVIKYYALKRCMDETAFPVFRNQDMTLTISGVGKIAAASAVAYTQGRYASNQAAIWLNIGVAGHASLEIGNCRIAHKIVDHETSRHWYPSLLFSSTTICETSEICTVSQPESQYNNKDCLYEMEAAGFIATASRFSSLELIQSLKIISDNHSVATTTLNAQSVARLIENQLDNIDRLKQALENIRSHTLVATTKNVDLFQNNWNFTTHQLTQLKTLLSQWQILSAETLPTVDTIAQLKTSKQVIGWLKNEVSALPVIY